jgi:hypothetical protein
MGMIFPWEGLLAGQLTVFYDVKKVGIWQTSETDL